MWRERQIREETNKEISTLVHTDQLARNRYYVSAVVDIIAFLAVNQLPLRGDHDSLHSMSESGNGLFLSLFEYTLHKDAELVFLFDIYCAAGPQHMTVLCALP